MVGTGRMTKTAAGYAAAQQPEEDRIIREAECQRLTGLSRTTRWRLEREGKFPRRRRLSQNAVGWLLSEILAWRAARPVSGEAA
jgi:prophage regulatory protein